MRGEEGEQEQMCLVYSKDSDAGQGGGGGSKYSYIAAESCESER